ncbi:MAG: response regulator [Elusimicrobiota bacterium]
MNFEKISLTLVAEDRPLERRMMVRQVERFSKRVLEASTAASTLEFLEDECPDLIILDLDLGDEPMGLRLCEAVRKAVRSEKTKIFVHTGQSHLVDDKIALLDAGAYTYFCKAESAYSMAAAVAAAFAPLADVCAESRPEILLVDDKEEDLERLSLTFEAAGFISRSALDAPMGIIHVRRRRPDAVLVDYRMPQMNGLDAITVFRSLPGMAKVPIFMISGVEQKGLEKLCMANSAADGFFDKDGRDWGVLPFYVRNMLRRLGRVPDQPLRAGRLCVDPASPRMRIDGKPAQIPRQEWDLLVYLMRRSPDPVSWEELQREIWALDETEIFPKSTPCIDKALSRLRGRLGPLSGCIVVYKGRGVSFVERPSS